MFVVAALFLIWAWRGARLTLRKSFVALIAISSAVVLLVQMVEFPAAGVLVHGILWAGPY